jgi:uncharacterized protein (DUF433 family)
MVAPTGWKDRITVDAEIQGGKPVIRGTRVPIQVIIGGLAAGMTPEQVCDEYAITTEDIRAALTYAAEVLAEETVHALPSR